MEKKDDHVVSRRLTIIVVAIVVLASVSYYLFYIEKPDNVQTTTHNSDEIVSMFSPDVMTFSYKGENVTLDYLNVTLSFWTGDGFKGCEIENVRTIKLIYEGNDTLSLLIKKVSGSEKIEIEIKEKTLVRFENRDGYLVKRGIVHLLNGTKFEAEVGNAFLFVDRHALVNGEKKEGPHIGVLLFYRETGM